MKKMNKVFGLAGVVFAGMVLSTSAQAQTMYRCGSTYQDRPCDGAQKGSKLVGGTSGSSSANGSGSDAACAKRGTDAQKIVWAREGGAMLDQQLAKTNNANEQKLINDVYARRGTSSDIRAAIEADCIAAKEKAAQAAALLEAARTGQPPAAASHTSNPQNKLLEAEQNAEAASAKERAGREAANKKIRCDYMKNQLDTVVAKQRAGGDAARMDDLNQQKQEAERRLTAGGC